MALRPASLLLREYRRSYPGSK